MKCASRSRTSSAVLQTQSKNISRLNEVSTRTTKTQRGAREAVSLLVKQCDVLGVAQDFATNFARMQKTLVSCGFLACSTRTRVTFAIVADHVHEATKRREDMRVTARNRCAKFFSTASLNRPLQALIAIEIERITPRAIRAYATEHRRRDARGESNTRRRGSARPLEASDSHSALTFEARRTCASAERRHEMDVLSLREAREPPRLMIQAPPRDVWLSRCRACAGGDR